MSLLSHKFDSVFNQSCDSCLKPHYYGNNRLTEVFRTDSSDDYPNLVCKICLTNKYRLCDWERRYYPVEQIRETAAIKHSELPFHVWRIYFDFKYVADSAKIYNISKKLADRYLTECSCCHQLHAKTSQIFNNDVVEERLLRQDILTPQYRLFNTSVLYLCDRCFHLNNYFHCGNCSAIRHENYHHHLCGIDDAGDRYCEDCFQDYGCFDTILPHDTDVLEYHLSFIGNAPNNIYFGIELEVETKYRRDDSEILLEMMEDYAVIKDDSSVFPGFEIVTAPAALAFHKQVWDSLLDALPESITTSDACGLHVHISRSALSPLTIGKMVVFINDLRNKGFIKRIAGRYNLETAGIDHTKKISSVLKKSSLKYEALNLVNDDTIELRIFASTVDKNEFMARIEFAHALVYYCRSCSIQDVSVPKFKRWVNKHCKDYPYLCEVA